jgi:hypothetical protein
LREKDGLDLGYGVQRREKWPMYRRGWYQVMGGEVGFCGPVFVQLLGFSVLGFFCPVAPRQLLPAREVCDGLIAFYRTWYRGTGCYLFCQSGAVV